MKFWQKVFFLTLFLFLIAFDALGFILAERSFSLNKDYNLQAAQSEYKIIKESVSERIIHLSALYTELNADNLRSMIAPYADYYSGQGVYLALFQNGIEVFNSNPYFIPIFSYGEESFTYEGSELLIFVVGNELSTPLDVLRLVYMKDASLLLDFKKDMTNDFILISVIISLVLSIALLFLLLRLTRPFRKLGKSALSIAQGDYSNRAPVNGNDEVGQFTKSFNLMAEKIQEHIGELSLMSENKELFINDLTHEIRTPITAISGYAELLKIGNLSKSEQEKSIHYIIDQSQRMQNMVRKLADLAYMNHGSIENKSVDFESLITNVKATCKTQLEDRQITINTDIESVEIHGDYELLESLFQNLIENAMKYSNDNSTIDIKAYSENGKSVVSISDYGKGMDEIEIVKITEPFYRINKSRSRTDGGVGLGLALCARICEIHHAELEIESKPGLGTKIKIHFTTL